VLTQIIGNNATIEPASSVPTIEPASTVPIVSVVTCDTSTNSKTSYNGTSHNENHTSLSPDNLLEPDETSIASSNDILDDSDAAVQRILQKLNKYRATTGFKIASGPLLAMVPVAAEEMQKYTRPPINKKRKKDSKRHKSVSVQRKEKASSPLVKHRDRALSTVPKANHQ
jgi:hypothetical protein